MEVLYTVKYASHIFFLSNRIQGPGDSGTALQVKEYEKRGKMQTNAERICSHFGFVAHEWSKKRRC